MTLPGMRDRCHADRQRRQDLLASPAGRSATSPRRAALATRGRQGAPEPDLHHARPTCSGRWRWGWPRTMPISPARRRRLQAKRDRLADGLARARLRRAADAWAAISSPPISRPLGFNGDDVAFCRHITEQAGVTAIPVSAFYESDAPRHYARFAFCKREEVLDEAIARLAGTSGPRHATAAGAGD